MSYDKKYVTVTCTYIQVHVGVLIIVYACIQSLIKQTIIVYSFLKELLYKKYNTHVVLYIIICDHPYMSL